MGWPGERNNVQAVRECSESIRDGVVSEEQLDT